MNYMSVFWCNIWLVESLLPYCSELTNVLRNKPLNLIEYFLINFSFGLRKSFQFNMGYGRNNILQNYEETKFCMHVKKT